jgi:hypothetical protein
MLLVRVTKVQKVANWKNNWGGLGEANAHHSSIHHHQLVVLK